MAIWPYVMACVYVRVEVRIEPRTITEFLKWKNRMADYNGGRLPEGIAPPDQERNSYLAS